MTALTSMPQTGRRSSHRARHVLRQARDVFPARGTPRRREAVPRAPGGAWLLAARRAVHDLGADHAELAALSPGPGAQPVISSPRGETMPLHQHALGLLDDLPGVQGALELEREAALLLALHHGRDEQ